MDSKYEGNAMLISSLVIFAYESNLVFGPHLPVKQRRSIQVFAPYLHTVANVINSYTFKTNLPKSNYEARSNTVYMLHEKMVLPEWKIRQKCQVCFPLVTFACSFRQNLTITPTTTVL